MEVALLDVGEKGDGQGHREKDEVAEDRLGVEGAAAAGGHGDYHSPKVQTGPQDAVQWWFRMARACSAAISERRAIPGQTIGAAPFNNSWQRGQPSTLRPNTTAWLCFVVLLLVEVMVAPVVGWLPCLT